MSALLDDGLDACGCEPRAEGDLAIYNRPGLPAIDYRIGSHGTFLQRMLRRIPMWALGADNEKRPLAPLTTRSTADPAIALLDAWAVVADVLTFYQERIANEGFLRTATERVSILELARMIGYELNPGVAASTHLAFEVEGRFIVGDRSPLGLAPPPREIVVPGGTKVQSIPARDELPQTFETKVEFAARAEWNVLRPRLTIPQPVSLGSRVLYIRGIETGFVRGDRVLITADREPPGTTCGCGCGEPHPPPPGVDVSILEVVAVTPEVEHGRTRLDLKVVPKMPPPSQRPLPTAVEPLPDMDFVAPTAPAIPAVAPAEIDPPVFALRSRPLTADEIRQRILNFVWRDAWLAAQVAVFHWKLDTIIDWINHRRHGLDLGPVWTRVLVTPARDTKRPRVAGVFPRDGTLEVHPNTQISVTFSEPMNAASAIASVQLRKGDPDSGDLVDLTGIIRYDAAAGTVRIEPNVPPPERWLDSLTTYYVVVLGTAQDQNGLSLAAGLRTSFHVKDYEGPTVVSYGPPFPPPPNSPPEEISVTTTVSAKFSEAVDTVNADTFFLRDAAGTRVPADIRLSEDDTRATLTPRAALAHSMTYTATLTGRITDRAKSGNRLTTPTEWSFTTATRPPDVPAAALKVYGFREQTAFFGHNAPKWASLPAPTTAGAPGAQRGPDPYERSWDDPERTVWTDSQGSSLGGDAVRLDREVRDVEPKGWTIFETATGAAAYYVSDVSVESIADYGVSGRATRLKLSQRDGISPSEGKGTPPDFRVRQTSAHVRSVVLDLVELPVEEPLEQGTKDVVLNEMVVGLKKGRVVALRGELYDLPGAYYQELLVVEELIHGEAFTTMRVRDGLERTYVRKTVTMTANVVAATHGETVAREVLGGGDGTRPNQRFELRRPPLTYVTDPNPSGALSTLEVRVDGVRWDEAPVLYGLGPRSRRYIVRRDDAGRASVIFGDGERGARPPSGAENIVARYRTGIGLIGMIGADRLTLMTERAPGVASVTNPLPTLGAAEPEDRDAARENAPLTVLTMERIVSLRDFEDFARGFAGIGKAQAMEVWKGAERSVHVTVAASTGDELPKTAPLRINLETAIEAARDPAVAVEVASFDRRYFDLEASLRIDPAYVAADVIEAARRAALDAFSFKRRSFGQPVTAAEVVEELQRVPGVVAVYLRALYAVGEEAPIPTEGDPPRPLEPVLVAQRARLVGAAVMPAEMLLVNPGGVLLQEQRT